MSSVFQTSSNEPKPGILIGTGRPAPCGRLVYSLPVQGSGRAAHTLTVAVATGRARCSFDAYAETTARAGYPEPFVQSASLAACPHLWRHHGALLSDWLLARYDRQEPAEREDVPPTQLVVALDPNLVTAR